jgi:hypothetical protein
MQRRDSWIIEIAELDSTSRGEVSKTKAFMSAPLTGSGRHTASAL